MRANKKEIDAVKIPKQPTGCWQTANKGVVPIKNCGNTPKN